MWFSRLHFHLSYRMSLWALIVVAMLLAGGYLTISYIYEMQDESAALMQENKAGISLARDLKLSIYKLQSSSLEFLYDTEQHTESLFEEQYQFEKQLKTAQDFAETPEETQLLQQTSALFDNYRQTLKEAIVLQRQGSLSLSGRKLIETNQSLLETIGQKISQFLQIKEEKQITLEEAINSKDTIIRSAVLALGIGGSLLGLLLGWFVARMLINPIYKMVLKVRDAEGSESIEKVRMPVGKELEEIDQFINRLIERLKSSNQSLSKNRALLERTTKLAALGRIAPALAHEIRNPLTSIKLLIYTMLQEEGLSEEKKQDFQVITSEISRVEGFIQNFLKFARPTKPSMQLISLDETLKEVINLLQARFSQGNIRARMDATNDFRLMADKDMLKQVFINLMVNACEAMPQGGELLVKTHLRLEQNKSMISISVIDSGKGIPVDIEDSLFDPFVKGNDQGTGLGLSISQRIAELHHGWISAANNPDKGATFTVHLPKPDEQ